MGEPTAPQLPANAPKDLRDFFECRATTAVFTNGPQPWLDKAPNLAILPGKTPTSAKLDTAFGQFDLKVVGGGLIIDWGKWQSAAASAAGVDTAAVDQQIADINAWFRRNGFKWGPATFDGDTVTLHKVPLKPAGQSAQPPATAAAPPSNPQPKAPPPKQHPPMPGSSAPTGTLGTASDPIGGGAAAPPGGYLETKVPKPELPKKELFPPTDDSVDVVKGDWPTKYQTLPGLTNPSPTVTGGSDTAGSSGGGATTGGGPVVGAGGPGGPKAPSGLGKLVVVGAVGVILAAILGLVLFGGRPSGGETASGATASASAAARASLVTAPAPRSCDLAALILALGATPDVAARICENAIKDGTNDRVEYDGTPVANVGKDVGDLVDVRFVPVEIGPGFAAKVAAGCAARTTVFCAETPPSAGPHMLWGLGMAQTIDQAATAFLEVAIAYNDATAGNGVGKDLWESSIGDPLNGSNLAYSYRLPSLGSGAAIAGPYRLAYDKGSSNPFFFQSSSGAFVLSGGKWIAIFIPTTELEGVVTWRPFTFYQEDNNGPKGIDLVPEPGQDWFTLADKLGPITLK